MIADEYLNRPKSRPGFRDRPFATFDRSQVGHDVFQTGLKQLVFSARDCHHMRAPGGQESGSFPSDTTACSGNHRNPAFYSRHFAISIIKTSIIKNYTNVELIDKYQVAATIHALRCIPNHPIVESSSSLRGRRTFFQILGYRE